MSRTSVGPFPPRPTFGRFDYGMTIGCLSVVIVGSLLIVFPQIFPSAREASLYRLRTAISEHMPDVRQRIEQHLAAFPDDPAAVFLAAEQAIHDFDQPRAIELFLKLPDDGGHWSQQRELGLARCCRVLGRMFEEERHLRKVLEMNPHCLEANDHLGHLLQVQGRAWESSSHLMTQILRGKCRGDELMAVCGSERFFRSDPEYDRRLANSKSEKSEIGLLGTARRHIFANRSTDAEQTLRRVIAALPSLGEAQGRLGRMIVDRGVHEDFLDWRGSLPDAARNHPEVWFAQGLQSRRIGQTEGAIYCFLQTIRLSPNHLPANVQIAGCLKALGDSEASSFFEHRAGLLADLETTLTVLRSDLDRGLMLKAAQTLGELGRNWEAAGWVHVARQLIPSPGDPVIPSNDIWARLAIKDYRQNSTIEESIAEFELERYEEPIWSALLSRNEKVDSPSNTPSGTAVAWGFAEEAEKVGIKFQYFEGTTEETRLQHIFNVVGGGMAVVDYDLDLWPDLHIAQANDWQKGEDQPLMLDAVYRNRHGDRFEEVTQLTGLIESGFSHGICAGDYDQDGFPDLYVSNLGANRLFRNNGDGTFEDVSELAGVTGEEWSITSLLADFNSDGFPDLYVGNYSVRDETAKKICRHSSGEEMACTPDTLTAESDRLYLNLGDGRFRDITELSGIKESSGRALAIVGWDFTGNRRTSLFVANDTSANFLFHNLRDNAEGIPEFSEEGVVLGLAFDGDGNAQASMGVAAGDANCDGRLDLFITNFQNESNTFYSQNADGYFQDLTRQFNLRDSGFGMLGFGTQFIDCDGDGWEDLLAANGHVDKGRDAGATDRMRPQLFRNNSGQSFEDVPAVSLGAFFKEEFLARGLATLDWNGDGRQDFAVSHLHAPFSLVTNHTGASGRAVSFRLIATSTSRSGQGARIRARVGGRDQYRFAVAGGGYLTTNCNSVSFFVQEGQTLEELEVTWSNGDTQIWKTPSTSELMFLVEGRESAMNTTR